MIHGWIAVVAPLAVFSVMLSLGLLLTVEHLLATLRRPLVLLAVVFAAVVPLPLMAVATVEWLELRGPVALGILLMSIAPGAPVALRRAIEAGSPPHFAPTLHLAIVGTAVFSVPACVWVLDRFYDAHFEVSPRDVGRQVLLAQLLPLAIGAAVRARLPGMALRIEPAMGRLSNLLLLLLALVCLAELGPAIAALGWVPGLAGAMLTLLALACGRAFAGWHAPVWPAGAVATAMRNPGLALLVASVNRAPPAVTAAIFGYALGLALVITAFVARRQRRWPDAGPA